MASYKHMDDDDGSEKHYATCCTGPFRMDIRKAAYAISFFGCALGLIQAVGFLLSDNPLIQQQLVLFVSVSLIGALMYLSISVALYSNNRLILLPYLISQGIYLVFYLVGSIGFYTMAIATPESVIDAWNKHHPEAQITIDQFRVIMYYFAMIYTLSLVQCGWFYSVVYRAYKHMAHTIEVQRQQMA